MRVYLSPQAAQQETGSLRLQGGGINQTLAIASNFVANEDTVDLIFSNVLTTASYSLTYIASDGTETQLVQGAAYSSLEDNSLPTQTNSEPSGEDDGQS